MKKNSDSAQQSASPAQLLARVALELYELVKRFEIKGGKKMEYKIREMKEDDAKKAWNWAKKEGWNPGLNDWKVFPAIDPDGCFAGIIDDEMISSITAIQYGRKYGFIGMYIVKPEYRGQGYGYKIWKHAMKYLNDIGVKCIGLDGVLSEENTYKKSGFKSAYKTTRYKYVVNKEYYARSENIKESQLTEIAEYDLKVFKAPRRSFLKDLLLKNISCAAYKKEKIVGFAGARQSIEGYRIGPCFADSADIARQLLETIFAKLNGKTIFIDIPEANIPARALSESYRMEPDFACIRMYTTSAYNQDVRDVFGNSTFEVG